MMTPEWSGRDTIGSLLVFSDDWGRHPSSCQHLVRHLLDRYPVLWVNTIGTRAPRFDRQTFRRVAEKARQWGAGKFRKTARSAEQLDSERAGTASHSGSRQPTVVNPKMWPWFSSERDRRLNRWLISRQLTALIQQLPQPVVAITTLPITADLTDVLPVDRWVYYCVDDFSQWPGLDGQTLRRMDRDMIVRADSLVAVSETLQTMIQQEGRSSAILTHGVDVDFWNTPRVPALRMDQSARRSDSARRPNQNTSEGSQQPRLTVKTERCTLPAFPASQSHAAASSGHATAADDFMADDSCGPRIVFWGVIDRRMDTRSLQQLSRDLIEGTIFLIGPQQDPDPAILSLPNVRVLPAQPMFVLPEIAAKADVLIMPYADLPVTRAMQPLKLKEYLATGRAVVVNRLPSTDAWSDCLDVAENPEEFSRLVRSRLYGQIPASQAVARCRLQQESWKSKAEKLESILRCGKSREGVTGGKSQVITFPSAKPASSH